MISAPYTARENSHNSAYHVGKLGQFASLFKCTTFEKVHRPQNRRESAIP